MRLHLSLISGIKRKVYGWKVFQEIHFDVKCNCNISNYIYIGLYLKPNLMVIYTKIVIWIVIFI